MSSKHSLVAGVLRQRLDMDTCIKRMTSTANTFLRPGIKVGTNQATAVRWNFQFNFIHA